MNVSSRGYGKKTQWKTFIERPRLRWMDNIGDIKVLEVQDCNRTISEEQ